MEVQELRNDSEVIDISSVLETLISNDMKVNDSTDDIYPELDSQSEFSGVEEIVEDDEIEEERIDDEGEVVEDDKIEEDDKRIDDEEEVVEDDQID